MDYPKLPTLKKKEDNQSLVVLIDGPLPLPSCFFFFLFFYVGQLYRRIHSSRVMVEPWVASKNLALRSRRRLVKI